MELEETESEDVNWIRVVQGTNKWLALANTVMNHRVPQFVDQLSSCALVSEEPLCSIDLIILIIQGDSLGGDPN